MRPTILLLPLPLLLAAAPDAAPVCPTAAAKLAPPLAGWNGTAPVLPHAGAAANLPLGRRFDVTLVDGGTVRYVVAPEKAPPPGTNGGVLTFRVVRAATYRVALGTAAWLDVVKDGKPVAASAHGHGAACSGIRKMVDFALAPGRYALQISGSKDVVASVMVTALP